MTRSFSLGQKAIPAFVHVLEAKPELELVCGVRLGLLGRTLERQEVRYYGGRLFARAATLTLGVRIHDPQCGAKVFRATPALLTLFQEPFRARWLLDVEILARLIQARRGTALPPVEHAIYEYPLDAWQEVPGSKVRPWDLLTGLGRLARIWWRYRVAATCP